MKRMLPLVALMLSAGLAACDKDRNDAPAGVVSRPSAEEERAAAVRARGKDLLAYAPPTDFSGAAPEDAAGRSGAFFDGSRVRDAVAGGSSAGWAGAGPSAGKRIRYTAAASERLTDLGGKEPPLPDTYDYSRSGATPGTARGAGQTLLGFAQFQLEQKFPSVAPIMSRLGWNAAAAKAAPTGHSPYRVTVHHTQGAQPMNEAETAVAVKNIQHYHQVGRGREGKDTWSDIGYHFLIAGDGRVIEGRRAEYLGAHAGGANDGNIGVAMMGDFNKHKPTDAQVESLTRLVTFLSVKYKKDPAMKGFLEGHQHYNSTDCPGSNLMAMLGALRRKIDQENETIIAGGKVGTAAEFTPLAVLGTPSA